MKEIPKDAPLTLADDPEFKALEAIIKALAPLDKEARSRVVGYVVARFSVYLP